MTAFTAWVEPHPHEVRGASLVLATRESPEAVDLFVEDHRIAGTLERLDAAGQPPGLGCMRRRHDANGVAFHDRARPSEWPLGFALGRRGHSVERSPVIRLCYGPRHRFTTYPQRSYSTVPASGDPSTYFRKGFGLKSDVEGDLAADYSGQIVDYLREHDYTLVEGEITVRLAREFGFCYGVERAVEYAYQTRRKFPDRKLFLVGEIIHNPHVNGRLREMGVEILEREESGFDFGRLSAADVVILPAFGVTIDDFTALREIGCVLVDTTCGSVLNVWKRVESYAREGFTALIHGKHYHEETRATASQVRKYAGGQYLIVRNIEEARTVCEFIEGRTAAATILDRFAPHAVSPGFDPAAHLQRIGVANQTTILASESLAIAEEVGAAIAGVRGAEGRERDFRSFDTICSATQDRQDAVRDLLAGTAGRDGGDRWIQLEQYDLPRGALRATGDHLSYRKS